MSQYQTTGFINQPAQQQQMYAQQPAQQQNLSIPEYNLQSVYSQANNVIQNKLAQGYNQGVLMRAQDAFNQMYMSGVIGQQVYSTCSKHQLSTQDAYAIADRFISNAINQVIKQGQSGMAVSPQPVYGQQQMYQQPQAFGQPMYQQPVYGQQQAFGQPVYPQQQVYGQQMYQQQMCPPQPVYGQQQMYQQPQAFGQPVYQQQTTYQQQQMRNGNWNQQYTPMVQRPTGGTRSIYRQHREASSQVNAAPTPTVHDNRNPATYTSMPPLSRAQQPQAPKTSRIPKEVQKMQKKELQYSEETDFEYLHILDAVKDELKQYLDDACPTDDVKLMKVTEKNYRGDVNTVDSLTSTTFNLKWPVNSVEQAVADAFDGMENLFKTGSTEVNKFGHIVNAKIMEAIRMPYERGKAHFDAVMKVVNNYNSYNIEVDITDDDGVVLQTVKNGNAYYRYVNDILIAIKRTGGKFLESMERMIVKEFNIASEVFFTKEIKTANGIQTAKFTIDSLDELGQILKSRIHDEIDDLAKIWTNDIELFSAFRATLDASLFTIFRKDEDCYMDITKGEDVSTIYMSAKVGLKSFGQPTRYGFATFSEQPETVTSDMLEKVKTVFVFTRKRSILVHNLDMDPIKSYTDDYDFSLKNYADDSTEAKMLVGMLINGDVDDITSRNLLAVRCDRPDTWHTPVLCGRGYDTMKLLTRRVVA